MKTTISITRDYSGQFKILTLILLLSGSVCVCQAQNLDIKILRSLNSSSQLPADEFFKFISNTDLVVCSAVPAGIVISGLASRDKALLKKGCYTFAAAAINAGISTGMKYAINRDRPFITYPDITKKSAAGSPSFPSGHTSSAFALATSLSLSWPKWYVITPSYVWAGTVAYSRMRLGVHYPSDVAVGALTGAGSAWLTYIVNRKLNKSNLFRSYISLF